MISVIQPNIESIVSLEPQHSNWHEKIQKDKELSSRLDALVCGLQKQTQRIFDYYLFDQIEYGSTFEEICYSHAELDISQCIDLITYLAKITYFVDKSSIHVKKCGGHYFEAKDVPPKKFAYTCSEMIRKMKDLPGLDHYEVDHYDTTGLFFQKKIMVEGQYWHVDNYLFCPDLPELTVECEEKSFSTVIDSFNQKLDACHIDKKSEWSKLTKQIFGSKLVIKKS